LCSDGEDTEFPILGTPITLALEVDSATAYLNICYSTTPEDSGAPAATGGRVQINLMPSPSAVCLPDSSPILLGASCEVDADTIRVVLVVQGEPIAVGIGYGSVDSVICLRDVVVTTPTGPTEPVDVGVCS
jgi:hypothetical protein